MRIIEKEMVSAFNACKNFRKANTEVQVYGGIFVYLHGNCIAYKDTTTGRITFTAGGWHTRTTASRLRALGAPVHIKDGRIVWNETGQEIPFRFTGPMM